MVMPVRFRGVEAVPSFVHVRLGQAHGAGGWRLLGVGCCHSPSFNSAQLPLAIVGHLIVLHIKS